LCGLFGLGPRGDILAGLFDLVASLEKIEKKHQFNALEF
jgi:hypothetical protein